MEASFHDMELLAKLLENSQPTDHAVHEADDGIAVQSSQADASRLTPADLFAGNTPKEQHKEPVKKKTSSCGGIWDEEEIPAQSNYVEFDDGRTKPKYEFLYRQRVGAEDLYLGMGDKDPSSSSCEQLVVRIFLPGAKGSDINLDVTSQYLDCRTKKFKLVLPLPHKVDDKNGNAQWDPKKESLSVALPIIRDDF